MLVRRIATVTICAPRRLDRGARLLEILVLAGADQQARRISVTCDDQLFHIGRFQSFSFIRRRPRPRSRADRRRAALLREATARNDLAVALQRNAFAGESQLLDQLGDGERIVEAAPLAVDGERDHAMCSGR